MTKLQLHNLAVRADYIYNEYDERTANGFGEGIKMED